MPQNLPRKTKFVTFPEYVCFWPLILLGVLLPSLQDVNPDVFTDHTCALIWGTTLVVICNAVGQTFGRGTVALIALLTVSGYLGMMWYGTANNVDVIQKFKDWINAKDLGITPDLLRLISIGLTIGFVWMILDVLVSSKRFEANFEQIERRQFLRGPKYYRNTRIQPARALLDDILDYILSFGGPRVYAFEVETGRVVNLGIAVGWGSKLDKILDGYAQATPVHDLGQRQDREGT